MKQIATYQNLYILSLAKGEELFESLLTWCNENTIKGGFFTGLGAADKLQLAYYNLSTKEYEKHDISEEVEILSLHGNLGTLNNEKILHIHGVFGKKDLSTCGGHLFHLSVSGACEVHFTALPAPLNRKYDDATGLNMLCQGL